MTLHATNANPPPSTSQDLSVHLPIVIDVASGYHHARPLRQPRQLQANAAPPPVGQCIHYRCNCVHGSRGLGCVTALGGDLFAYFEKEASAAHLSAKDIREPNNLQRKRMYRHCAHELGYSWRRRLPDCVVAAIRTAYPEASGHYMGFYDA